MPDKKIIIGVIGLTGSGKDTVAEYLAKNGFTASSLSDRIREECDQRGLPKDRDRLIQVGNELRDKFGHEELAKRSLDKIKNSDTNKFLLSSIRHPKEAEYLKNQGGLALIAVETPIETRYERNIKRGRAEDNVSFEKFKEQEQRECTGTGAGQQLDAVISMADYTITNSGTLEELYEQIDQILEKL